MTRRTPAKTKKRRKRGDKSAVVAAVAMSERTDNEIEDGQDVVRDGFTLDFISGTREVKETPKELVRQRIARALFHEYGISVEDMAADFPVRVGGRRRRVDIAIFAAGEPHTPERIQRVVICRPEPKQNKRGAVKMRDYALPRLGEIPVDKIAGTDVMDVLLPIWFTRRDTARSVRQRIGAVMKWAVAQGHRPDNPAGDALSAALPNNAGPRRHQRALPHAEVGAALARVRASGAHAGTVLAFEFLVLTAARSGEVRNARWEEFDLEGAVWTIPAERMKAGRAHRVPLSPRALEVLDEARRRLPGAGTVFPTPTGRTQPHPYMARLLHELEIDAVPHGFRSSFRDWAAECTDAPREVCELALAHVNRDRVEAAYRRSDLFDRRRILMTDWAAYVA